MWTINKPEPVGQILWHVQVFSPDGESYILYKERGMLEGKPEFSSELPYQGPHINAINYQGSWIAKEEFFKLWNEGD